MLLCNLHEGNVNVVDADVLHVDGEVGHDRERGAVEEEERDLERQQVHVEVRAGEVEVEHAASSAAHCGAHGLGHGALARPRGRGGRALAIGLSLLHGAVTWAGCPLLGRRGSHGAAQQRCVGRRGQWRHQPWSARTSASVPRPNLFRISL